MPQKEARQEETVMGSHFQEQREKVAGALQGLGGRGRGLLLQVFEGSGMRRWCWLYNTGKVLDATELHILA